MDRVSKESPTLHAASSFLARPGHKLASPGSPSKALSNMTVHFLNSCGPNTKTFCVRSFPFQKAREGKNRKLLELVLSSSGIPFPTPSCLQAALYPVEICRVSCSCAQVRLPGTKQLLGVLQVAVQSPDSSPRALRSQRLPSATPPTPLQFLVWLGAAF